MPQIGFGQDTATILTWHRSVGESIGRNEALAEVEVEKANLDVEVHQSGVVAELVRQPGDEVAVGEVIAYLDVDPASGGETAAEGR